jgi:putative ABC transport system ATP-binding protein
MSLKMIIETVDVTRIYGKGEAEVRALDGVSMQIRENEFVAIMGPSGSGKSSMMNILGCLDRPTTGQYFLVGEDVSGLDKKELAIIRNQRIGFVFQAYNLLPNTSALDNVMLPMLYNRKEHLSSAQMKERALAALDAVGLANRVHHLPSELSGGQMQRVAIARSLVNGASLVLADEPTGNLDTHSSLEVMTLLTELHNRGGTIVMVTHEENIAEYAQRIIRFRDGHIDQDYHNGTKQVQYAAAVEVKHESD